MASDIPGLALLAVIGLLIASFGITASGALGGRTFFPGRWFPGLAAGGLFTMLIFVWCFAELSNNVISLTASRGSLKDSGSFWVVSACVYLSLLISFLSRSAGIGGFSGPVQYIGLIMMPLGVLFRQWAISILGRNFTIRVEVDERRQLTTAGPYRYIRHPSYTGSVITLLGLPLAIGTGIGLAAAAILSFVAYGYRIMAEEKALTEAFGKRYVDYKNKTWAIFPGL